MGYHLFCIETISSVKVSQEVNKERNNPVFNTKKFDEHHAIIPLLHVRLLHLLSEKRYPLRDGKYSTMAGSLFRMTLRKMMTITITTRIALFLASCFQSELALPLLKQGSLSNSFDSDMLIKKGKHLLCRRKSLYLTSSPSQCRVSTNARQRNPTANTDAKEGFIIRILMLQFKKCIIYYTGGLWHE